MNHGTRQLRRGGSKLERNPFPARSHFATLQNQVEAEYQWQISSNGTSAWMDISGAIFKDYTPTESGVVKYYRRIARNTASCGGAMISTSDVSVVVVNANITPIANAGGVFNTCEGISLSIGHTTIATGGLAFVMKPLQSLFTEIDVNLTLDGLRIIGELVKSKNI